MKFTQLTKEGIKSEYTDFQSTLRFYIKLGIFSFKGYGYFLWPYMYTEKLKELSNLLIFYENELILS